MKQHFQMMAAYNRWANGLIYDAASELSAEDYARDVGAFFHSMNGTLNHILVADRIWMKRFTGQGEAPAKLDAILHDTLPALKQAREAEDERIIAWIDGLDDDALQGRFTYTTVVNPRTISQLLSPALTHFFNHQTHHRGHAHMILSVLGKNPPSLDLIYFHRTLEGREYSTFPA